MAEPYLENCRLVGGTALALQYGHRSSVDLDLFGDIPDDDLELLDIPWIDNAVEENGLRLASPKEIAAMKINAIEGRGSKKDFIDLYFLLQHFSFEELLYFYIQKYPDNSMFRVRMSLDYYDDAENQDNPKMFEKMDWIAVKETISKEVKNFDWRKYIDK